MARRLLVSSMMQLAPKFCRAALFRRQSLCLCLALLPLLAAAETYDQQDLKQLEALAKTEAALQFPALTERQRFLVGPIDPHLQLQKCQRPIRPVVASPQHMRDRVMIELRLRGAEILAHLRAGPNRRHLPGRGRGARHRGGHRAQGRPT